jgi:hypothetical protein
MHGINMDIRNLIMEFYVYVMKKIVLKKNNIL